MTKTALVVSDVDGTLLTKEKLLTDRAIGSVRKLHEAGIGFTITSSRPTKCAGTKSSTAAACKISISRSWRPEIGWVMRRSSWPERESTSLRSTSTASPSALTVPETNCRAPAGRPSLLVCVLVLLVRVN